MRTLTTLVTLIALATLCAGCAGIPVTTTTNRMFVVGDDSEAAPAFTLEFGPPASALKDIEPADKKDVLLAYAKAAGEWLNLTFNPVWTQTVGTTTETDAEADTQQPQEEPSESEPFVDPQVQKALDYLYEKLGEEPPKKEEEPQKKEEPVEAPAA